MSAVYVDTSAIARILLEAPDAPAIRHDLTTFDEQVSSRLFQVELRRVACRVGLARRGEELLRRVEIIPMDEAVLQAAETIEPYTVATLDAIHLATARRLHVDNLLDAVMTFDTRLAEGARHHGIAVVAPA